MIRQFVTFDEAAEELETDREGLRQGFETGLACDLPAYAYSDDLPFLGVLQEINLSLADSPRLRTIGGELVINRAYPSSEGVSGDGLVLDRRFFDDFADFYQSDEKQRDIGYPVTFVLNGYFRISHDDVKKAARKPGYPISYAAPFSWWSHDLLPQTDSGDIFHWFFLLERNNYCSPPAIQEFRFHIADLQALKARQLNPNRKAEIDERMDPRERISLLCIIGALASEQKLDLSHPYKAAESIAAMIPDMELKARTIGDHLKAVQEAMDSRRK